MNENWMYRILAIFVGHDGELSWTDLIERKDCLVMERANGDEQCLWMNRIGVDGVVGLRNFERWKVLAVRILMKSDPIQPTKSM
jgi:hypothetical protein